MKDVTLLLEIIILLEVRLDSFVRRLEFSVLPVSFRAFEIRLFIEDRRFLVRLLVASLTKLCSKAYKLAIW